MKRTIYLVPHTHYDVAWAFTKEDYLFINSSILKKAIRMIRDSNFRFLIEQTYLLEMIEQRDPELFSELEEVIRSDKIEIADGQYVMPDTMIPGGEVLIRQIQFGKLYAREKFGVDVPVAWAADGFGLNAQMPQIYKKSGYRWLAFRRGLPALIGSRVSEFMWEGIDGTKIISHWMPLGYRAGLNLSKWQESYDKLAELATTDHILMPCGSGGAIPQEDIPEKLEAWNNEHDDAKMVLATPHDFFENFAQDSPDLITYSGELYSDELEDVFPDVASSRIRLTLAIRAQENQLLIAEKLAALALLRGKAYPVETMTELWKKKLFLADHDVLASCGIDEIYKDAWQYIQEMDKDSLQIIKNSLNHIMLDKKPDSYVIVFNPNNWEVTDWVQTEVELGEGWSTEPGIFWKGSEVPSEVVEITRWDSGSLRRAKVGLMATVPPLGCAVYQLNKKGKLYRSKIKVKDEIVETSFLKLKVDKQTGLLDIANHHGDQLLRGNEIIIEEEIGDLYFHKSLLDKNIGSESGEGLPFGIFKPEGFSIKKGPIRTIITFNDSFYCLRWPYYLIDKFKPILYRHKTLDVSKQVIVYNDIPRIDFVIKLNLVQPHVRVRLKFDTCMVAPQYTRQIQFGVLDMPYEKTIQESFKIPSLNWVNAQEGDRGLAMLTQRVPINEIRRGEIYLTLLRSVSVLSADGISGPLIPTPEAQELGEHNYYLSVYLYDGNWKDMQIHRRGFEKSQPLRSAQVNRAPAMEEFRSFTLEPDNLILSALKKAERDNSLILRFFETKGESCKAMLGLPPQIKSVETVNLLEETTGKLDSDAGKLEMDVAPFEIVSLKLSL